MRIYTAADEEALRARDLLKDWHGEGFVNDSQYQLLEKETVSGLRRTNIYLRAVLFLFTLIIIGATLGLFATMFFQSSTSSVLFLFFGIASYVIAEKTITEKHFYRHGIEEAFAVCAVGLLCLGMENAFNRADFLVAIIGAVSSVWIWHRFGLWYASLAAMVFTYWLADEWTSTPAAHQITVAVIFAVALAIVATIRRPHRFTYLNQHYSIAEALLWLGIYATINIQLSSANAFDLLSSSSQFPKPFFWTAWALTWLIPPIILTRGIHQKDRFTIAVGALAAVLTLATNKSYLGWPRHTWDPMLLGALLIAIALLLRRWLAKAPEGIRHGFTAQRLSGKDKTWLNVSTAAIGVVAPSIVTPAPQPSTPDVQFGGGASGGGGASSDF